MINLTIINKRKIMVATLGHQNGLQINRRMPQRNRNAARMPLIWFTLFNPLILTHRIETGSGGSTAVQSIHRIQTYSTLASCSRSMKNVTWTLWTFPVDVNWQALEALEGPRRGGLVHQQGPCALKPNKNNKRTKPFFSIFSLVLNVDLGDMCTIVRASPV